jgi:glycosyltransferase involved in cell wall biosynthesis
MRDFAFIGIPLFHTERPWAASPLFAPVLSRCDAVVAMTQHEKRFVEQRSRRGNAHVIGAGVEPALFARADGKRIRALHGIGDAPVVGYVGRMSASKGLVTLIEAMRIVWRQNPAVRLLLAGSGLPSSGRCEDVVRRAFDELSEAERSRVVALSSFRDDEKASIFDAMDIFAMTSVAESFGIAYLEAWMCRTAVIGSRIASTECVIDDGVDGLLVSPGEPMSVADAILALLADPQRRTRMGEAGHVKTLASFTWDRIADRVETVYRQTHERVSSRRSASPAA